MPDVPKLTFQNKRPTPEEIAKLAENQPICDFLPLHIRVVIAPENTTRKAYTAVRGIYLALGDEIVQLIKDIGEPDSKTWLKQFNACRRKLNEADAWLKPPLPPLSLEDAFKVLKGFSNNPDVRDMLTKQIGKRPRRGQPASKRHLAVIALDSKCAYPFLSLRDVTEHICPCGKSTHTPECREQLRQQINGLIKFLKRHGFDFTWERIAMPGWKERP